MFKPDWHSLRVEYSDRLVAEFDIEDVRNLVLVKKTRRDILLSDGIWYKDFITCSYLGIDAMESLVAYKGDNQC